MLTNRQIQAYLYRIGIREDYTDIEPNLPWLEKLQRQHLRTVPFENLSIHYGEEIVLEMDWLYDKIVRRRRGGFCYELNGLFFELLKSLGYDVRLVSARVYDREKDRFGPEFDHMAIIINVPGEGGYLVEVGFGRFATIPLRLDIGHDQRDGRFVYRIVRHDPTYFRVMHSDRGMPFDNDYLFSLLGQDLEEFEEMCRYHQTSPDSHFTQKRICSMATRSGRISLSPDKFIVTNLEREETPVHDEKDFRRKLQEYFQIELSEDKKTE